MLWTQRMSSYEKMYNVCNVGNDIIKKSQCRLALAISEISLGPGNVCLTNQYHPWQQIMCRLCFRGVSFKAKDFFYCVKYF